MVNLAQRRPMLRNERRAMLRNGSHVPRARLADPADLDHSEVEAMWTGDYVEVNDQQLFVRTTPATAANAEPALCVHGLGGAATNWTDFAGLVRNHLQVDALDLLGHGRTPAPAHGSYSPAANAAAVIGYIEQSGRGPVHLIGNSMGGAVVIRVAAQRPDLIRTLTLVSPAVPDLRMRLHPLKHNPRMAVLAVPGLGDAAMRRATVSPEQRVRMTIKLCFADPARFPARRMAEAVAEATARAGQSWANDAFLRSLRALARTQTVGRRETWSMLRSIEAPALVVWGDTDRLVAPDLARPVAALLQHGRVLVLDDVGHVAHMEAPVTTARAVVALIEDAAR